jgi:hypothetical protein
MPHEQLLLYGAQHDQHEAERRHLGENAKRHAERGSHLGPPQHPRDSGAEADACGPADRIAGMPPSALEEDHSHQKTEA